MSKPRILNRTRTTAVLLLTSLVSIGASRAGAAVSRAQPSVPSGWLNRVETDVARSEYRFSLQPDGAYAALNRAQGLRILLTEEGVSVVPRAGRDEEPSWMFGLHLTGFGRDGSPAETGTILPRANDDRAEYWRDALDEVYLNESRGLEQSFTLRRPPLDASETLPVVLEMRIEGDVSAFLSEDGGEVIFKTASSAAVLRYGELRVTDARGDVVSAHLEIRHRTLRIVIDDRGAIYPITVDPLMTSPAWTGEGNGAAFHFGYSVGTAGDVNGDGFGDVVVGAEGFVNGEGSEGRAFVYLGSASGLATSPAWTAESNQVSAFFGRSVGTAGDVNGDGYSDVFVGAPLYDNGQADEGAVFVWYGGPSGLGPNGTPANASWRAESDQAGALFGTSAGSAGDVNGDGYDDVIGGAYLYHNGQADEGKAFVWYGGPSGLGTNGTPANAAWSVESDQIGAQLGFSAATAGDVNGDGYADVVVGVYQYTNTVSHEGRVYVYHGSASGPSSSPSWHDDGNARGVFTLGYSVAAAGDVNGDGYGDLIVGATGFGDVLLYHGSATGLAASPATHIGPSGGALGYSVATAGDVNGDGFADVVAGAAQYTNGQTREGRAYAYLGSPSGISTTPFWSSVETDQAESDYGNSVATAGDVNGDGFSDVIAGCFLCSNGEVQEGQAFVYYGSADGLAASAGWNVEGNQATAQLGWSLASAGDVNGDGYGDVIVGVPFFNPATAGGKVLVYLGTPSGPAATASWTASGDQADCDFGWSVATAGDVNGDGYGDVIVGADHYSNGSSGEGRAYVFLGSATGLAASAAWTAEANQSNAELGSSVASAGDVNGDGYGDVTVGADGYSNGQTGEGAAFVWHGSASGLGANGTPGNASWRAESDQAGAQLGKSVASAGDVNRDGFSDVIVGAPFYDSGETDEGKAFVWYGSASGLGANGTPSNAAWSAESNQTGAELGISVASAGDVNGDGYSDVIVGAPLYDNGQTNEGKAFVWLGSSSGLGANGTPGNASWSAESDQDSARLGWSVAGAGDTNGDGYSDVLAGAYLYSNGESQEGAAFTYLGSASGLTATPAWSIESGQINAHLGIAVAGGGDTDGDGFADVLVSASDFTNGETREGRAFVYYGGGRDGLDRAPRQARADGLAPIGPLGKADSEGAFRLRALGRAPAGRTKVKLEWEVKPLGTAFNGTGLARGAAFADTGFPDLGAGSAKALEAQVSGLSASTSYHWRLRVLSTSPFFPHSPWLSPPFNARTETDLRTGAGVAPFVSSVTPPDNSENQNRGTSVVVTFSEALLASSVTSSTVRLLDPGSSPVTAAVLLSSSGRAVTIDPAATLAALTRYTVQVTSGVQDLASTAAVPFTSHFTTDNAGAGGTPLPNVSDPSSPPPSPANAKVGSSVAGAGDLDRDGVQDFVAGSPGYTVGANAEAGAAIVYLGSSTSASDRQSPDIIFTGAAAHDRAGVAVSSNFDFNGDGIPDILIGAEQVNRTVYPGDPTAPGKVYLIYFDPTDTTHYPNLANPSVSDTVSLSLVGQPGGIPGVVFTGVTLGDQAGFAVSGRGFPGDPMWPGDPLYPTDPLKYAAITIGAPGRSYPNDPIRGRGAAYVIFPTDPLTPLSGTISLGRVANGQGNQIGGVVYEGAAPGDRLGFAVTLTGDITGASGDDIVLAAPYADPVVDAATQTDAGAVYVAGGGSLAPATVNVANIGVAVNGTQILGDHAAMLLGYSVAAAGLKRVWPGDPTYPNDPVRPHVDLLMGAPGFATPMPLSRGLAPSTTGADAGAVFHSVSKLPGGIIEVCAIGGVHPNLAPLPGTVWTGQNAGDQLGYAVAVTGDINANGTDDYAFGAPFTDPNGVPDAGTVYIVDGVAVPATVNGMVDVGTVGTTTDGSQLVGTQVGENAGSALAGTGDINGGGSPDLVAGAPGKDVASDTDAGTVYEIVLDDGDGDGTKDGQDCAPGNAQVWSLPGEVASASMTHDSLGGVTTIAWTAPVTIGGTPSSIRYDTIRSTSPSNFTSSAICLETGGADTLSTDTQTPTIGQVFYYLVRGTNTCGGGVAGTASSGQPVAARVCP